MGPGQFVGAEPCDAGQCGMTEVAAVRYERCQETGSMFWVVGFGAVCGVDEFVEEPAPGVDLYQQVDEVDLR